MTIQCPTCLTENDDNATACVACGFSFTSHQSSPGYHLPDGTTLRQGEYQIEKLLGDGGFGITYKGVCLQNYAPVAIKELWPERAARSGNTVHWPNSITPTERQKQIQNFQTEASYLSQCIHQNIVRVYEWFEENNTAYIVMEFLTGKTLYQMLKEQGKLPEDKVKSYFIQIAQALKVVHDNQLLHRDIKPDNILVDAQDRAVLIDFGATKEFIAGQTRDMSVTLTRGYAPLEQYSYRGQRWPATDFYALCASMYEVLTHQLPVDATDRATSDTLIPPRQLNPSLSPLIEKVILTGMRVRVEERFQTADELIDALTGRFISPSQRRARDLVTKGDLRSAVNAYQQYLKLESTDGESWLDLALVQVHINDNANAKVTAGNVLQLLPNDSRGYAVLGLVSCRQSSWQEAVKYLEKAVNLTPRQGWIYGNLAWALGKVGDWRQAEEAVTQALRLEPESTFCLGLKAWIAVNQRQWRQAIPPATQAIFKSKSQQVVNQDVQGLWAWVYPLLIMALDKAVVTKQARDVERRVEEFISQLPDSALALGFQGWQKAQQGLWQEALVSFGAAKLKPQPPAWVLISGGICAEHLDKLTDAIQYYENYRQLFDDDDFVCWRLGTLYGRLGEWAKGRVCLQEAVRLNRTSPPAYHNLGWVLLNIRDRDHQLLHCREILSAYSQAVRLYTEQNQDALAAQIRGAFRAVGMSI